jgi:hypothetical protein
MSNEFFPEFPESSTEDQVSQKFPMAGRRGLSPLETTWVKLLSEAVPDARERVDRTFKQWNNIVRDILILPHFDGHLPYDA